MSELSGEIVQINKNISAFQKYLELLPDKMLNLGIRVVIALIMLFIGSKLIKLVRRILEKTLKKTRAELGVIQFLDAVVKISLYVVLFLVIANNFGFDATGVVAILGSAGVTLGLALQGSLSNLAGGVLILILKPFRVNDYIKEDSHGNEGTVKEIGIFYTKLETVDRKIVVLPNGALANNSITNYSTSKYRRIDVAVGISYNADIKKAKEILTDIINNDEDIVKEQPISVFVDSLGSSEVVLGMRGFCLNSKYWDTRWRLIEKVKLNFDSENIEIPFNQLTVHLEK